MADVKITALPASAGLTLTDIFPTVDDPGGAAATEKATYNQLVTLLNTVYGTGPFLPLAGGTMGGDILFSADNTIDIGASGATRPRTGFFGTSVVTALVDSPAATALQFSSAGTARAFFATTGHLLWNADVTYDIGQTGANRPRRIFAQEMEAEGAPSLITSGSHLFMGKSNLGALLGHWTRGYFTFNADGVWSVTDNAGTSFGRLQFGGTTSAFPALKRSAALLQARLADDSLFTEIECSNIITNNAAAAFSTNTTLTDFAAAQLGTLTNAPTAGNPAKWIAIDDNGTTRFIPTWV